MHRNMSIPHQRVTFASGEDGTIRADLSVAADGRAHGHLAVTSREGGLRYRAVNGVIETDEDTQAVSVSIQLEETRIQPGIEDLVQLTLECRTGPARDDDRAAFTLSYLQDGREFAQCEVSVTFEAAS